MKLRFLFYIGCICIFQSCGYLAEPEGVGELQINLRFANEEATALPKSNSALSLQAVDRVVVIIRENIESATLNGVLDRDVVRKEFRLGSDRTLKTTIEVPLQNADFNFFDLRIEAFQGLSLLYAGQDFILFDAKIKRVSTDIQLEPVAFRLFLPTTIPPTSNRLFTLTGQMQDTSVTELEIIADSVSVRFPVQRGSVFTNPVMLLGNTTTVRTLAYRGNEFYGEASRQVTYTGTKADILIVLAWNQVVNLDLEIINPLQQIISPNNAGDDVNGRLLLADNNGYGPEVFEWRENSGLLTGLFLVRVSRPRTNLLQPASGRVYVFLRERQNLLLRRIRSFVFQPQELQVEIFNDLLWPPQ